MFNVQRMSVLGYTIYGCASSGWLWWT